MAKVEVVWVLGDVWIDKGERSAGGFLVTALPAYLQLLFCAFYRELLLFFQV